MSVAATCNLCSQSIGSFATPSALMTALEEHDLSCPRRPTRATRLIEGAAP